MPKPKQILSDIILENGIFGDGDWIESKDQDPLGDVRIIQLADIGDGKFINKSNRFMTYEKALELNCTFLNDGDILLARMPDPLGRACIYKDIGQKAVTVVDIGIIRPNNADVKNQYLKFLINSSQFRQKIKKYTTGTTRKRISKKNLNKIKFELAARDDQIHIANLLSQVESLITKREESIKLLDEFLKSTFLDMFGDPILNPKGWEVVPLYTLGEINRGISKHRPRNAPELLGGKCPLIQTGDVSNSDLYIESFTQTYSDIGLAQSKLWAKDTLCITIAANIAKTAILKFEACFPDSVVGMIIDKDKTNLFYVHFLFKFFQKLLEKNAPQAAQKNINLQILRTLKVPKPPKPFQDKFTTIVQQVEQTKQQHQKSLQELKNLFGSLSQRAFRGELV